MKVEKRLPFGFVGEWGRVYKEFIFDEKKDNITYQNKNYVSIESDVQFKSVDYATAKRKNLTFILNNLSTTGEFKIAKTTDSYFNDETKQFECVISIGDIVFLDNCYWSVEQIEEKNVFTPNKQSIYYLNLKNADKSVLGGKKC